MGIRALLVLAAFLFTLPACAQPGGVAEPAATGRFRVVFDPALQDEPYVGRVYVVVSKRQNPEPRSAMWNWYQPMQVLAVDVKAPVGGAVDVGPGALGFPKPFEEAAAGAMWVQAIARRNPDNPEPGQGEGDLYSDVEQVTFRPGEAGVKELRLSKVAREPKFRGSERIKEFSVRSAALSEFSGRERSIKAGVILPKGWTPGGSTKYPVLYFIGGFGGTHHAARQTAAMFAPDPNADRAIIVVPDPTCYRGHSVFADSANNGPWGRAFTEELLPAIDAEFRGNGSRYVTGVSSGGWASLWLAVAYPDVFRGIWSHCPDPVDFRDFQRINLYAKNANMYRDEKGERRPLARSGNRTTLWYDDFVAMETVMGPGGQIHSFEAVFSPKGEDGEPRELFDRATGDIDPVTAKAWEAYDINLIVERNWATLGPKLRGKLHVYAGGADTYFLEGAARLLKDTLSKLGSDADYQVIDGMVHTIHGPGVTAMFETIAKENP